ncbi:MAG: hypothetical protein K2O73_04825, partial [Lachnospiraceae bacterium]|nr:hypothetical protein [Lachnospiraceae bacterium]
RCCHTPLKRLMSAAGRVITLMEMEIQPVSNKLERSDFPFPWGSEQLQKIFIGCNRWDFFDTISMRLIKCYA